MKSLQVNSVLVTIDSLSEDEKLTVLNKLLETRPISSDRANEKVFAKVVSSIGLNFDRKVIDESLKVKLMREIIESEITPDEFMKNLYADFSTRYTFYWPLENLMNRVNDHMDQEVLNDFFNYLVETNNIVSDVTQTDIDFYKFITGSDNTKYDITLAFLEDEQIEDMNFEVPLKIYSSYINDDLETIRIPNETDNFPVIVVFKIY